MPKKEDQWVLTLDAGTEHLLMARSIANLIISKKDASLALVAEKNHYGNLGLVAWGIHRIGSRFPELTYTSIKTRPAGNCYD